MEQMSLAERMTLTPSISDCPNKEESLPGTLNAFGIWHNAEHFSIVKISAFVPFVEDFEEWPDMDNLCYALNQICELLLSTQRI